MPSGSPRVGALAGGSSGELPLLERERELGRIRDAVAMAVRGDGRRLSFLGPPGAGKTRLLESALEAARAEGMLVLRARGATEEQALPYGVARQLFEPVLRDERIRAAISGGRGEPALALLEGEPGASEKGSMAITDGLYWLVVTLAARRPIAVAIDDAHWADTPSVRFASYLARRLTGLATLLVVARREPAGATGEPDPPDEVLRPAALGREAVEALLEHALATEASTELADACSTATGGNPLLVVELIRTLAGAGEQTGTADPRRIVSELGPRGLATTVRSRLRELDEAAAKLAETAAVLGDRIELRHAAELAELEPERAAVAAAALRQAEILREGPLISFVHPLMGETLKAGVEPLAAERTRERAIGLLERTGAPAAAVARQLLHLPATGDWARVEPLRQAARTSMAAGDHRAAAAYLERALSEPPAPEDRADVLLELAAAEGEFDGPRATERIEQAIELVDDPGRRAELSVQLAAMLPSQRPDEAIRLGLDAASRVPDEETERRLLSIVATAAAIRSPVAGLPDELVPRLREGASRQGPGARMLAAALAYRDAWQNEPLDAWLPAAERAFTGDWLEALDVSGGPLVLGLIALISVDSPTADRAIGEWSRRGRLSGEYQVLSGAKLLLSHLRLARGELAEAAADGEEALEAMEDWGMRGAAIAHAAAGLAEAALELGELARAADALSRARCTDEEAGAVGLHGLLATRARMRAAGGELRAALDETLALGERFEGREGLSPGLLPWRSRAAILMRELDAGRDEPLGLVARELELAEASRAPRAIARALVARAELGEPGEREAVAARERAIALLETIDAPLDLCRACLSLGNALISSGEAELAREPLRRALELAVRCGAVPLERRAREALLASGARPRRTAVFGPRALTSSERRACELAAGGLTNREIAERLYLTPRTVETHLTSAYRKLGIAGRAELESALAE